MLHPHLLISLSVYELTVKQDHPYHGHRMLWAHCTFQVVSQSKKEQILICHLLNRNLDTIKEYKSKPSLRLQKIIMCLKMYH